MVGSWRAIEYNNPPTCCRNSPPRKINSKSSVLVREFPEEGCCCLFDCLVVWLFVCLFACLFVWLSFCLYWVKKRTWRCFLEMLKSPTSYGTITKIPRVCFLSYQWFYFSFHMKTADIHTRLTINHYLLAFFFDCVCFNIFYYVLNYYTLFLLKPITTISMYKKDRKLWFLLRRIHFVECHGEFGWVV